MLAGALQRAVESAHTSTLILSGGYPVPGASCLRFTQCAAEPAVLQVGVGCVDTGGGDGMRWPFAASGDLRDGDGGLLVQAVHDVPSWRLPTSCTVTLVAWTGAGSAGDGGRRSESEVPDVTRATIASGVAVRVLPVGDVGTVRAAAALGDGVLSEFASLTGVRGAGVTGAPAWATKVGPPSPRA